MSRASTGTLKSRHNKLEDRIAAERQHPSSDDLEISRMKKQKLALKDCIES